MNKLWQLLSVSLRAKLANNMQDQINLIIENCKKANPDIVALKPGCRVLWTNPENEETKRKAKQWKCTIIRNWGNGAVSIIDDFHVNTIQATTTVFENDFDEILGREIRLADVLLAIVMHDPIRYIAITPHGAWLEIISGKFQNCMEDSMQGWDMKQDNLELQSEECIEFIYNLLK